MKRTYKVIDGQLTEVIKEEMFWLGPPRPIGQITLRETVPIRPSTFIPQDWAPRSAPFREQHWWNFRCDCCQFPYMEKADELPKLCPECVSHQPTERCELICSTCREPSYAHPVEKPNMYCTHDGVSIVDPKVMKRWQRMRGARPTS